MKTESPAPAPLVSDEAIAKEVREDGGDGLPVANFVRGIYEADRAKMIAERDELVAGIRWLDRWMGDKPMIHCANKVRALLSKYKTE